MTNLDTHVMYSDRSSTEHLADINTVEAMQEAARRVGGYTVRVVATEGTPYKLDIHRNRYPSAHTLEVPEGHAIVQVAATPRPVVEVDLVNNVARVHYETKPLDTSALYDAMSE